MSDGGFPAAFVQLRPRAQSRAGSRRADADAEVGKGTRLSVPASSSDLFIRKEQPGAPPPLRPL
ncbi:hypothetical protein C725_0127 [Pacificimonas flava]|uniref:Uncharacterized protein n=1 Tax=Pacificimonas flava TaxID=1234595 RepID=M2U893_9SPHN|nr:hypothetical protein C725_0127 [Pacificimonas flava]